MFLTYFLFLNMNSRYILPYLQLMFFVPDQPSKLLYVVGDDPVIKGLSLLQLWKKPVTLGPGHVITVEDFLKETISTRFLLNCIYHGDLE